MKDCGSKTSLEVSLRRCSSTSSEAGSSNDRRVMALAIVPMDVADSG